MKTVLVIGIGAGNPDHMTVQAIEALNRADVFFVMDKGAAAADLVRIREEICRRFIREPGYRIVMAPNPEREKSGADYLAGVRAWHEQRAILYEDLIETEIVADGCGAFLVWGDPALYDSTIRVLDDVAVRGKVAFRSEVIPGISSAQALAAAHRIPLNRIGAPVRLTTGRRLAEGLPGRGGNHGRLSRRRDGACRMSPTTMSKFIWGAYLGTADEVLVSGRLGDVRAEIADFANPFAEGRDGSWTPTCSGGELRDRFGTGFARRLVSGRRRIVFLCAERRCAIRALDHDRDGDHQADRGA